MNSLFKGKSLTTVLILALALSSLSIFLPTIIAQEGPRVTSYAHIDATPNPVGVGQEVLFLCGIDAALARQEQGWKGLWITIERPDGVVDKITDIMTDSTGNTG